LTDLAFQVDRFARDEGDERAQGSGSIVSASTWILMSGFVKQIANIGQKIMMI